MEWLGVLRALRALPLETEAAFLWGLQRLGNTICIHDCCKLWVVRAIPKSSLDLVLIKGYIGLKFLLLMYVVKQFHAANV